MIEPVTLQRNPVRGPTRWPWILKTSIVHATALAAPWYFSASGVLVCFLLMPFCSIWITMCWHRLLSHASFSTYPWLRYTMTTLGCLNLEGGPVEWVGSHRRHHSDSDGPEDPHSPRKGLRWAHLGWLSTRLPFDPADYARDLVRDPVIRCIDRLAWVPAAVLMLTLYGVGELWLGRGVSWVLWGGCVRTVLVWHATWIVNSWTHKWGYRNFDTPDDSRNSALVAFFTFGEGWHNNHHAQQRSAAHGMLPGEFDATYAVIRLLERLGLVWDVVRPDPSKAKAHR